MMIRALILYYLSLKSTHGYEIQKFIQLNQMDSWTKIQSGSIYYALAKLEKEGLISLEKTEQIGSKTRKIYGITEKGKIELTTCVKEELNREIYDIGSDKFIIYPILQGLNKQTIVEQIKEHIESLRKQKVEQEKWQSLKISKESLRVEKICFEMMLSSLDYQIQWHKALLEELDQCMAVSKQISNVIRKVDFSTINELSETTQQIQNNQIEILKQDILNHPDDAEKKLEQLIQLLKNK